MRSSLAVEVGAEWPRWAALVCLVATLALEVVDAVHGWRPSVGMTDCLAFCELGGAAAVQGWGPDRCDCAAPVDTGAP